MEKAKSHREPHFWRNIVAFWILGLTNNYGYVVMLTAAHDIVENFSETNLSDVDTTGLRSCNDVSTGIILIACFLPACIIRLVLPFLIFWVHVRIFFTIALSIASFITVAFAKTEWVALGGVAMTSLSIGIGETTFLAYSSRFNINHISAWSSGTGGSGIFGSLSYAGLRDMGLSVRNTMLIMICIPVVEAVTYLAILRVPMHKNEQQLTSNQKIQNSSRNSLRTLQSKLVYIPSLMKYIIPYFMIYFFEYSINMGLYELIYFRGIFMSIDSQFRWLNFVYQLGVFIARSSVNIVQFHQIWLLAVVQGLNFVLLLFDALYFYIYFLWIIFVMVLCEGILGGAAYVNTYYKMTEELPNNQLVFAMSCVSLSDSLAVGAAGLMAILVFKAICALPEPRRP